MNSPCVFSFIISGKEDDVGIVHGTRGGNGVLRAAFALNGMDDLCREAELAAEAFAHFTAGAEHRQVLFEGQQFTQRTLGALVGTGHGAAAQRFFVYPVGSLEPDAAAHTGDGVDEQTDDHQSNFLR